MAYREAGLITVGLEFVTAVVVGLVGGITVVALPPLLRELVVVASELANTFYAGVLLGTFLGLFIASFTAFLTYRVYRLQQLTAGPGGDNIGIDDAGNYVPVSPGDTQYEHVADGDPPWFNMYLIGTVSALVVAVFTSLVWPPLVAGVLGALASARLFGGF